MTAREQAAILPSETVETPSGATDGALPGQWFWQRLTAALGRSVQRALNRRRDRRNLRLDLRHLSSRALRDLGLEPDVFDRR